MSQPVYDPLSTTYPGFGTPESAPVVWTPDQIQPATYTAPLDTPAAVLPAPEPAPATPQPPTVSAPPGGSVVDLPSGFKVALRSPKTIRNSERPDIYLGIHEGMDALTAAFRITQNIVRLLVVAWDVRDVDDHGQPFGDVLPIPRATAADVLGGLMVPDANAFDKAAEEARAILLPDFSVNPDEASPTQPSAG